MSDLVARLKERCEFNKMATAYAADEAKSWNYKINSIADFNVGARYENERLKPVLDAMLKCVEALEIYALTNETFPEYGDVAREALTELREAIGVGVRDSKQESK